jgi:serine/threonine protein phosphatase PrpC
VARGRRRAQNPPELTDPAFGTSGIPASQELFPSAPDPRDALGADRDNEHGWVSRTPIIVGRPVPDFEPRAITDEFRTIPYRPDLVADGWSDDVFTIRAASIRGYFHRYNGSPRQDDFAIISRPDKRRLIVAVADGVSSAPQSHIGATTAVRYSSQWLDTSVPEHVEDTNWRSLIENTAWALVQQSSTILSGPDMDAGRAETVLATTLVCAVIEQDPSGDLVAHLVGVGDSGAFVFSDDTFRKVQGGKEADSAGLSSSTVIGLPRVPAEIETVTVRVGRDDVLLISTDGFGDPFGSGDGEVGRLFASVLRERPPSIIEFAHALDFSRETFDDDRTLVAVWPSRSSASDQQ